MKTKSTIYRFLGIIGISFALVACSGDGTMEQAGKKADEIINNTGNAIEDSCERVKEHFDAQDTDC